MKTHANGIDIEYERFGHEPDHSKPCVALIMGLGMQMIAWPMALIEGLVEQGFEVLRFDNRDIGLSTFFDHKGVPNILWAGIKVNLGLKVRSPYTLTDMANDTIGLFDALGLKKVHVVGASMGGMIAQLVASNHPHRVLSLTSIMSTSGRASLPGPTAKARGALLSRPSNPHDRNSIASHFLRVYRTIGSPNPTESDAEVKARILEGIERSYHPVGTARQLMAVAADGSRVERLKAIKAPTLVIHGEADPLVPIAAGRDTAASIPGAQFISVPGMGHDLTPVPLKTVQRELISFLKKLN